MYDRYQICHTYGFRFDHSHFVQLNHYCVKCELIFSIFIDIVG